MQAFLRQLAIWHGNWFLALIGLSLWPRVFALAVGGTTARAYARTALTGSIGFIKGQVLAAKEPCVMVGVIRNHPRHLARHIRSQMRIITQHRDALWTTALGRPYGPSRESAMRSVLQSLPAIVTQWRSWGAPTSEWSLWRRSVHAGPAV